MWVIAGGGARHTRVHTHTHTHTHTQSKAGIFVIHSHRTVFLSFIALGSIWSYLHTGGFIWLKLVSPPRLERPREERQGLFSSPSISSAQHNPRYMIAFGKYF